MATAKSIDRVEFPIPVPVGSSRRPAVAGRDIVALPAEPGARVNREDFNCGRRRFDSKSNTWGDSRAYAPNAVARQRRLAIARSAPRKLHTETIIHGGAPASHRSGMFGSLVGVANRVLHSEVVAAVSFGIILVGFGLTPLMINNHDEGTSPHVVIQHTHTTAEPSAATVPFDETQELP